MKKGIDKSKKWWYHCVTAKDNNKRKGNGIVQYKVIMGDNKANCKIEMEIEAKSIFEAIDVAADKIENPEETELIEAFPI